MSRSLLGLFASDTPEIGGIFNCTHIVVVISVGAVRSILHFKSRRRIKNEYRIMLNVLCDGRERKGLMYVKSLWLLMHVHYGSNIIC